MSANACNRRRRPARAEWARHDGFTLIELVMVIVMLGVLAVFAAPRLINSSDTNARGFHDGTLSYLRYAQKTAIAQRRTVCVAFTGTTATLRIASAAATTTCDTNLIGPLGETPGTITAKTGTSYSSTPLTIHFDGLGQPLDSTGVALTVARTMQVANAANAITVEAATGYVHE